MKILQLDLLADGRDFVLLVWASEVTTADDGRGCWNAPLVVRWKSV
ncbi:hypothetical protein N9098_01090 [bacterium]|nr:hypothetical protein [bacterium]